MCRRVNTESVIDVAADHRDRRGEIAGLVGLEHADVVAICAVRRELVGVGADRTLAGDAHDHVRRVDPAVEVDQRGAAGQADEVLVEPRVLVEVGFDVELLLRRRPRALHRAAELPQLLVGQAADRRGGHAELDGTARLQPFRHGRDA